MPESYSSDLAPFFVMPLPPLSPMFTSAALAILVFGVSPVRAHKRRKACDLQHGGYVFYVSFYVTVIVLFRRKIKMELSLFLML